jgi:hypothetical protein
LKFHDVPRKTDLGGQSINFKSGRCNFALQTYGHCGYVLLSKAAGGHSTWNINARFLPVAASGECRT